MVAVFGVLKLFFLTGARQMLSNIEKSANDT
jgi:hypothetical protein